MARDRIVDTPGGGVLEYWYTIFFPGLTIFLFILAWKLIGNAARDLLDPHRPNMARRRRRTRTEPGRQENASAAETGSAASSISASATASSSESS